MAANHTHGLESILGVSSRQKQGVKHERSEDVSMATDATGTTIVTSFDDSRPIKRERDHEHKGETGIDDNLVARAERLRRAAETKNDSSNGNNGNEDETFYDLLCTFAKMEYFHEAPPEPCPVCQQPWKLAEFAKHVIDCVDRLDKEAVQKQMEQDAALALELAFGDNNNDPSYRPRCRYGAGCASQSRHHFRAFRHDPGVGGAAATFDFSAPPAAPTAPKFNMALPECINGAECTERGADHFRKNRHPDVNCPICSEPFAIYEMSAHVTLCLQNPEPRPKDDNALLSRQPTLSVDQISMVDDGERKARQSLSPIAERSERPARSPFSDDGGIDLSRGQLSAMARVVMETKEKDSVAKLLDSFKLLGFTQEKLKRALHGNGSGNDPSSSPPASAFGSPVTRTTINDGNGNNGNGNGNDGSYMTRGDSSSSNVGVSDDDDLLPQSIPSSRSLSDNDIHASSSGRTIATSGRSDSGVSAFRAGQRDAAETAAQLSSLFGPIPSFASPAAPSSSHAGTGIASPVPVIGAPSVPSSLPTLSVLSSPPPARLISLAAPPAARQ